MQKLFALPMMIVLAAPAAFAQTTPPPPAESGGEPISILMFFTLGVALLIGIGAVLWFLRKRSNRAAMEHAFKGDQPRKR